MKRGLLLLLAFCVLSLGALAAENGDRAALMLNREDLVDLEAPVAGLLAAELGSGLVYPAAGEEASGAYAAVYLFYLANIYYAEEAEIVEAAPLMDGGLTQYARLERAEVAMLLKQAFGDSVDVDSLVIDGDMLRLDDEDYLIGLVDGFHLTVAYDGADEAEYDPETPYRYTYRFMPSDGGAMTGAVDVLIDRTDDPDAPLAVAGFSRIRDAGDVQGNWIAEDGWWCSLMEDGLVYCFNDIYEVIGDGTYAVDGDRITFTLGGVRVEGAFDASSITISLDGGPAREYLREP